MTRLQLPHRVIEYAGRQIVQVPEQHLVAHAADMVARWRAGALDLPQNSVLEKNNNLPSGKGNFWREARRFPATIILIALSILGYGVIAFEPLQALAPMFTFYPLRLAPGGIVLLPLAEGLAAGQWWRLVSPAFLHFGVFHIVFNSLWLWELGRRVEFVYGFTRYLLFFFIAAIASNLGQHFWNDTAGIFGGMSGVVYALVGYIGVRQRLAPHPALMVPPAILAFMVGWLILCLTGVVDVFMAGGIANGAHVGGLVAGALAGLIHWRPRAHQGRN